MTQDSGISAEPSEQGESQSQASPIPEYSEVATASKGGLNAPVLNIAHQLSDFGEGQLYIQGELDVDIPKGGQAKIEFFLFGGKSAELIGTTSVIRTTEGGIQFAAVLPTKVMPGAQLVARAMGDFKGAGAVSFPFQVKPGHDHDSDGIDSEIEDLAPGGDGNRDGIPDSVQSDVASLPSQAGAEFVTLDGKGHRLTGVRVSALPKRLAGLQRTLPYGQFDFLLQDVPVADVSQVQIVLPEGHHSAGYYKLNPATGMPVPFPYDSDTGAAVSYNVVTLFLRDGGRGDADGVANGMILDPGLVADGLVYLLWTGWDGDGRGRLHDYLGHTDVYSGRHDRDRGGADLGRYNGRPG